MITVENLSKIVNTHDGELQILADINFSIIRNISRTVSRLQVTQVKQRQIQEISIMKASLEMQNKKDWWVELMLKME